VGCAKLVAGHLKRIPFLVTDRVEGYNRGSMWRQTFSFVLCLLLTSASYVQANVYKLRALKIDIMVPPNYQTQQIVDRILIHKPSNERRIEELTISFLRKLSASDKLKSSVKRIVGSRSIEYSTTPLEEVGSGGQEYSTLAIEKIPQGYIRYEHHCQTEDPSPDLTLLWNVISTVKILKN
jgi:hypothetical protein